MTVRLKTKNKLTLTDKKFIEDIRKSVRQISLHQAGKKKLKTAKELLNEI